MIIFDTIVYVKREIQTPEFDRRTHLGGMGDSILEIWLSRSQDHLPVVDDRYLCPGYIAG